MIILYETTILVPTDLTITTNRLMKLFQSVEGSENVGGTGIGYWLGLPESALQEIKTNFRSTTLQKEAYLDTYTHCHPSPCWKKIKICLQKCRLYQEANAVEKTYIQGELQVLTMLYSVMLLRAKSVYLPAAQHIECV